MQSEVLEWSAGFTTPCARLRSQVFAGEVTAPNESTFATKPELAQAILESVRVAGSRWATEECFQTTNNETRLDHYQVRGYLA